jgi:nucleotidyltransferase substrate binding protein (TIGR01987 family)
MERQGRECGGPRSTFKLAFAERLIATTEEADTWLRMLEDRNLTTHTYDESLAIQIYNHIVMDYFPQMSKMSAMIQTLSWD